jgi:hypothetical protein
MEFQNKIGSQRVFSNIDWDTVQDGALQLSTGLSDIKIIPSLTF